MMPTTEDFVEIVSTGKPRETKIIVNGEDIASRVTALRLDIDPAVTTLTLSMLGIGEESRVLVRGFLVTEEDMKAFTAWRDEKGLK